MPLIDFSMIVKDLDGKPIQVSTEEPDKNGSPTIVRAPMTLKRLCTKVLFESPSNPNDPRSPSKGDYFALGCKITMAEEPVLITPQEQMFLTKALDAGIQQPFLSCIAIMMVNPDDAKIPDALRQAGKVPQSAIVSHAEAVRAQDAKRTVLHRPKNGKAHEEARQ